MKRPEATRGLHHVALNVFDLDACERFYRELLGMEVEWRPDPDNVYLCSGNDNLALHRVPASCREDGDASSGMQRLDHIGFIVKSPEQVDAWYEFLRAHNVKMRAEPTTHRDGARSFYCEDPGGNIVQLIYHPPLAHL